MDRRSQQGPRPLVLREIQVALETAGTLFSSGAAKAEPGELTCRAGCFGCCIGLFEISLPEAVLVREGFDGLPDTERAAVTARAERIVRETAGSFPGDVRTGLLDPERTEEADDGYFDAAADYACPMLELPSGRCRVYEYRPITCRTYGLAWKREGEVIHPSCLLNFAGAPLERQDITGVDLEEIDDGLTACATLAKEMGVPLASETTLAHVVTGKVFETRR
jgi:Fe-S-cluster containining protein